MAIYPLSGASWPPKKHSSSHNVEAPPWKDNGGMVRRKEMQVMAPYNSRSSPRQWELRKVASLPILEADYWSDASLSFHIPPQSDIIRTKQSINSSPSPSLSTHFGTTTHHLPAEESELPMKAPILTTTLFPPPLDSPRLLSQGRHCHMKSLERVLFQSIRKDGRLILTEIPPVQRRRRHLCAERSNGRLVLRLHEEEEEEEEEEEGGDDDEGEALTSLREEENYLHAKQAHEGNVTRKEEEGHAQNGHGALAEDHDVPIRSRAFESARPRDEDNSTNVYYEVLRTIEPGDCEAFNPIPQLKHGGSCQVASFLHKSLRRVRPLSMLGIWQF